MTVIIIIITMIIIIIIIIWFWYIIKIVAHDDILVAHVLVMILVFDFHALIDWAETNVIGSEVFYDLLFMRHYRAIYCLIIGKMHGNVETGWQLFYHNAGGSSKSQHLFAKQKWLRVH